MYINTPDLFMTQLDAWWLEHRRSDGRKWLTEQVGGELTVHAMTWEASGARKEKTQAWNHLILISFNY